MRTTQTDLALEAVALALATGGVLTLTRLDRLIPGRVTEALFEAGLLRQKQDRLNTIAVTASGTDYLEGLLRGWS